MRPTLYQFNCTPLAIALTLALSSTAVADFTITGNTTSSQVLSAGETGVIEAGGSLTTLGTAITGTGNG